MNNVPNQLNSLRQEESVLQSNLNNLTPPVYNNSPEEDAKRKYQEDLNSLNTTHQNKQKEIEDNYQEDLKEVKTYQDNLDYLFNTSSLYTLTKSEREDYLNNLHQTVTLAKQEAETRINNRYQKTIQIAEIVSKGLSKNSLTLVNVLNSKISEARYSLDKMKHKVKDLKEAYEDNKDYKKDVKKYEKKVKKYTKKVKKHRHNGKKRRKYENKLSSAKKKYNKYLKKYLKYGSLKKAYKQSYQSAKNILKQYEEQFSFLIREQQQAQREYQASLKEASDFKNELIKQAQTEKSYYQDRLKLAEVRLDYDQIARTDNSDLDSYLSFVPATVSSTSLASSFGLNFSVGLGALDKLKKSLKKLKKKAKKAYKKAEKKAKKRREEENRRREAQRSAYYARLNAWKKQQAENRFKGKTAGTWFDSNGNGYSGFYSEVGGYSKTPPKPTYLGYSSSQSSKIPWYQKLLGATAWASTTNSYQPKKGWLDKVKDWGKDLVKNTWNGFKNSAFGGGVIKAYQKASDSLKNTWGVIKQGFGDAWKNTKQWYNNTKKTAKITGAVVLAPVVLKGFNPLLKFAFYKYSPNSKTKFPLYYSGDKTRGKFQFLKSIGNIIQDIWHNHILDDTNNVSRNDLIIKHQGKGVISSWFRKREIDKKAKIISRKTGYSYEKSVAILERIEKNALFAEIVYNKGNLSERKAREILLKKGFKETTSAELTEMGIAGISLVDNKSGFKATVYINNETRAIYFSFAGTEDGKDWLTNFVQGLGEETEQYAQVKKMADIIKNIVIQNPNNKYHNYTIFSPGHSLGGGERSLFAAITKIDSIGFNSSGLHKDTLSNAGVTESEFPNIINIRTNNDILTYAQEQAGNGEISNLKTMLNFYERNQKTINRIAGLFRDNSKVKQYTKIMDEAVKIKRVIESGSVDDLAILADNTNISLKTLLKVKQHWNNPNLQLNQVMPDPIGMQITVKDGFKDYAIQLYASYLDNIILNDSVDNVLENGVNGGYGAEQHGVFNYYQK